MRVNFFAKTKTNKGNFQLRHWKTIKIIKIVRFQSLNFTSKPKGYLLQTTKLWEKLIVLKGQMNQKIAIFSFVALPSPNAKKNHPEWDLGKHYSSQAFIER